MFGKKKDKSAGPEMQETKKPENGNTAEEGNAAETGNAAENGSAMDRLVKKSNEKSVIPHFKLRVALFIVFLVLGVAGITLGIVRIGSMKPGIYEIKGDSVDEASLYQNSFSFRYRLSGSSSENRTTRNELRALYMSTMLRSYKLTDPENEYENHVNLATLNHHPNEPQKLDTELYDILKDAYKKTQERAGFSVFAGPFYSEWNEILYLNDPLSFEPLRNAEEAEKLAALSKALTAEEMPAELIFNDGTREVTLKIGSAYQEVLDRYEIESAVLDLNLLRDAYRVKLLADALEQQNYTNGYITADSGVTTALSGFTEGSFALYAVAENDAGEADPEADAVAAAEIPSEAGTSASVFRSFAYFKGESGFYTVKDNGETFFRGPYPPLAGNGFLASFTRSKDGAAETVYRNIQLNAAAADPEEKTLRELVETPGTLFLWTKKEDLSGAAKRRIMGFGDGFRDVSPYTDYGFFLEEAAWEIP